MNNLIYIKLKYIIKFRLINQQGSISGMTVIILVALFPLLYLVADGGMLLDKKQQAIAYAQEAARAGQVASKKLLNNSNTVNSDTVDACRNFISKVPNLTGTCIITANNLLQATVTLQFSPMFLQSLAKTVSGNATAKLLIDQDNE